jgi:hypothetical protein
MSSWHGAELIMRTGFTYTLEQLGTGQDDSVCMRACAAVSAFEPVDKLHEFGMTLMPLKVTQRHIFYFLTTCNVRHDGRTKF